LLQSFIDDCTPEGRDIYCRVRKRRGGGKGKVGLVSISPKGEESDTIRHPGRGESVKR